MTQPTTFMLSRSLPPVARWQRNQNTVRIGSLSGERLGPVTQAVIIVLLLLIMGLMYLSQVNKTNAYTYPINELETKRQSLLDQKRQLEVEAAQLASLRTVQQSSVAKALVEVSGNDSIR